MRTPDQPANLQQRSATNDEHAHGNMSVEEMASLTSTTTAKTVADNTGSDAVQSLNAADAKPVASGELDQESEDASAPQSSDSDAPIKPHIIDANSSNDEIHLDLMAGFAQNVHWGVAGAPDMVIDEPEPLGTNRGPSPGRVLAAALASCLGASLLFCLKKSRIDVSGLHATASVALMRNERKRLRVSTITVRLEPVIPLDQQPRMARCLETFEDYCIITASVRPSVTVNVSVNPVAPAV